MMKWICFLLLTSITIISPAQVKVETLVDKIDASGGVNLDAAGNIVVADFGESLDNGNGTNVWKITAEGAVTLWATGLNGASGNDFDSEGNLFQSSIGAGTVSKIDANGNVSFFVSSGISCNVGIAIDPDDNLYVCNCCDSFGNSIRKVGPTAISAPYASGPLFSCPNGITIDKDNNLYVSNFGNGNIIKITANGQTSLLATTPGSITNAASNGHVTYSPVEEVLYVASHGSHSIFRLTLDGTLTRIAGNGTRGNEDGFGLETTFSRPNGLAITPSGDTMYVNSSIPTTDAGGRPLNPSKIRRITNLLGTTNLNQLSENTFSWKVFPNPIKEQLNLTIESSLPSPIQIHLYDMNGRLLFEKEAFITVGKQVLQPDLPPLVRGIYALSIQIEEQFYTKTIQIE